MMETKMAGFMKLVQDIQDGVENVWLAGIEQEALRFMKNATIYSIQFNSIQFNTDICTRQLMNITLARTAKKQNYREK